MKISAALRDDKFRDLEVFSVWVTALSGLLGASFWIWDFYIDPAGAQSTAAFRLLIAISGLIPAAIAHLSDRKSLLATALFGTPILWALLALPPLLAIKGDTIYGIGSFVFLQVAALLLLQCFTYRTAAICHLLMGAAPQLIGAIFFGGQFDHGHYAVLVWPTALLALIVQNNQQAQYAAKHALKEQLAKRALTDPPTGTYNRHYFIESARSEVDRAKNTGLPLSLLLIDIDQLRHINAKHGAIGGDTAIHALARLLQRSLRTSDLIFRWGGDVFLVLAPSTNIIQGRRLGERLRKACMDNVAEPIGTMTISAGAAELSGRTLQELVEAAEDALHQAKSKGGNCVIAAETPAATPDSEGGDEDSRQEGEKVSR